MKRKGALLKFITAVFCLFIVFSLSSCSTSQNSLDRSKKSSYSKVRTHQPSWNSSSTPKVRHKLKKTKKKKSSYKKNRGRAPSTKSQNYSIFK